MTILTNKFITAEGGEGSGKTTSLLKIKEWLESTGEKVLLTREPGGVVLAENIRSVIFGEGSDSIDIMTEALLYAAARREHLVKKVIPALEDGYIVLCDRFVDSSIVYQGLVRGLGIENVWLINNLVIGDYMPGLTLYYDIIPEKGLERISINEDREKNRFDLASLNFHNKIRDGYLEQLRNNEERIHLINAGGSIEEVFEEVKDKLTSYLNII